MNRGLGRGLDGLFSSSPAEEEKENPTEEKIDILEIDIEKISPRADQPRKHFDEKALENLKDSILEVGLLQPIVLIKKDENYEIVAGERRYRAAKKANLKSIPAIIKDLTEREVHEMSLIENIQREDLNPIEEALAYENLMESFQYTQKNLAEALGKSRSAVANTLRLLDLDEKTKEKLISGEITSSQGRTLLSIKDLEEREKYLEQLINKEISIKDIERQRKRKRKRSSIKEKDPFVKDLEDQLIGFFGTRVQIREKKKGGQIEIEYLSHDDLERILNLLEE